MLLLLRALELSALFACCYLSSFGFVYSIYVRKGGSYALLALVVVSAIAGPILLILCNLVGTTVSQVNLLLLLGIAFILNISLLLHEKRRGELSSESPARPPKRPYLTIALFLLVALSRIIQIDSLYVPNWIDGYNHFQIASRLLSSKTLIYQFYHIGFYLSALSDYRILNPLAQSGLPESILLAGQEFSILACVSFYLLAYRLSRHELAALISTAVYSFWSPFPSYLISWGRYPFLSGLSLLPLVALFLMGSKDQKLSSFFMIVTFVALLFYHYSALLFAICLLIAKIILESFEEKRAAFWRLTVLFLIIVVVGAKFYGLYAYQNRLITNLNLAYLISENAADSVGYILHLTWGNGGILVWAIGLTAVVSSFSKRASFEKLLFFAVGLIALSYLAQFLIFRGFIFGLDNFVIALPLFLCMFSIPLIDRLVSLRPAFNSWRLILIGVSVLGFGISLRIVNPVTVLFTQADRAAFSWLVQNTTPSTTIYINSFQWKNRYVPSDGGAWITALTNRKTVFAESEQEISDLDASIRKQSPEYIYLSGRLGELDVAKIDSSRSFALVYQQGGVMIFRILDLP